MARDAWREALPSPRFVPSGSARLLSSCLPPQMSLELAVISEFYHGRPWPRGCSRRGRTWRDRRRGDDDGNNRDDDNDMAAGTAGLATATGPARWARGRQGALTRGGRAEVAARRAFCHHQGREEALTPRVRAGRAKPHEAEELCLL